MIIVVAAVGASEAAVVASFFEKSLCRSLLCRRPQLGTLHVLLLQSFERLPGLMQLKYSLNFCTCSRRLFSFIDLIFSQPQLACCRSLNGQSELFGSVDSSALDAKALVFGFSRL